MLSLRLISAFVVAIAVCSDPFSISGASLEHLASPPPAQVSFKEFKEYLQPILYQKLLRTPGDSVVVQQTKSVAAEYLVDALVESIQNPEEPIRSSDFARQAPAANGTGIGINLPNFITVGNQTRPTQAHVINQVDSILQNVNGGNITGIVDQALRIRAPAPVQQLVNGIMNLVLCNPINRLWNRCAGGGGLFGRRR